MGQGHRAASPRASGRWRAAHQRGVAFLVERQGEGGAWQEFDTLAGPAVDWPTAFIAAQLPAEAAAIGPALRHLLGSQQPDGGWGYHRAVPSDADSTAAALRLLAGHPEAPPRAIERAAACLVAHQDEDSGGVATYREPEAIRAFMGLPRASDLAGWCQPHVEVTALAGRALWAAGPAWRDPARAALGFVLRQQEADGGWRPYWWTARSYAGWQAVCLAAQVAGADDGEVGAAARVALARAVAWALGEEDEPAFAGACALGLLACARPHVLEPAPRAAAGAAIATRADRLCAGQHAEGGWPSGPVLRLPPPSRVAPEAQPGWRLDALGTGVLLRDPQRLFTTATAVGALEAAIAAVEAEPAEATG